MRPTLQFASTAPGPKPKLQHNLSLQFGGITAYVQHPDLSSTYHRAVNDFSSPESAEQDPDFWLNFVMPPPVRQPESMHLLINNNGGKDADQFQRMLNDAIPIQEAQHGKGNGVSFEKVQLRHWKENYAPGEHAAFVIVSQKKRVENSSELSGIGIGLYLFKGLPLRQLMKLVERAEVDAPTICKNKPAMRPGFEYVTK